MGPDIEGENDLTRLAKRVAYLEKRELAVPPPAPPLTEERAEFVSMRAGFQAKCPHGYGGDVLNCGLCDDEWVERVESIFKRMREEDAQIARMKVELNRLNLKAYGSGNAGERELIARWLDGLTIGGLSTTWTSYLARMIREGAHMKAHQNEEPPVIKT